MFQTKVVEKLKRQTITDSNFFFNHAVYEAVWKNIVGSDRPQVTVWRMRIACWIPKVTNRLCNVLPQRQLLQECVSVTYSIYVHSLSWFFAALSARCNPPNLHAVFPGKAVEAQFSAEVENTCSFIATFPYSFMVLSLNTRMFVHFSSCL